MAGRKYFLAILIFVLFQSCAQVGDLEGGIEDVSAPTPDSLGMNPRNETLHFTSKEITIRFDEFFVLNDPQETVKIVPNDSKIATTYKHKTLKLKLLDSLKPNTTYAIYLNKTIKDLTEGNDSLMTYVFSTGDFLDSNKLKIIAFSDYLKEPISEALLGLYEIGSDPTKTKATYLSQSKTTGEASFNYLKAGKYSLFGFIDKNKNELVDLDETQGFLAEDIEIPNENDSIKIGFFQDKPKVDTILKFLSPNSIIISGKNLGDYEGTFLINNTYHKRKINSDSLILTLSGTIKNSDTLAFNKSKTIRWGENDRKGILSVQAEKVEVLENEDFLISLNDGFVKIEKFSLFVGDSLISTAKIQSISPTLLKITNFIPFQPKITLVIPPKSMVCEHSTNVDTVKLNYTFIKLDETGELVVNYAGSTNAKTPIVIDVLDGRTIFKTLIFKAGEKLLIPKLKAGTYNLRIIEDSNEDGKFTSGNLETRIKSEQVNYYRTGTKVRAGWTVEVKI